MLNPSYLIKSRHDIYYFRYPLPMQEHGKSNRVSVSLNTRCPKEALQLAKTLEYHASVIIQNNSTQHMNHADITAILKGHFAEVLEDTKARIDKEGTLPKELMEAVDKHYDLVNQAISDEREELHDAQLYEEGIPANLSVNTRLIPIMERYSFQFEEGSREHSILRQEYKYAIRNYIDGVRHHNDRVRNYSFIDHQQHVPAPQAHSNKLEYQLQNVIDKYQNEVKPNMTTRSLGELLTCLKFLTELLGDDFNIAMIDGEKARYVKECLMKTPARRNTKRKTKGLPLLEQIEVKDLPLFKTRTLNKYLEYFSGLCKWARNNQYISDDPFGSMALKDSKDGKKEDFNDKELALIFAELEKREEGLANTDLRYWSTLLFLYTGARRNEIASLTAHDVKQHEESGIWYLEITDEKKSKRFNKDAKRYVPIHSALIKHNFLEYVEKVKAMKGDDLRLLYKLTNTPTHGWGRKLTQWFSDRLLPELKIKRATTSLHSTRHTFITRMKAAGVDYAIIDQMVGHEGQGVSETIYTHYDEKHLPAFQKAIEKLSY